MKNAAFILSTRTRNALYSHVQACEPERIWKRWNHDAPDPKVIAKTTSHQLMMTPNFGWVSLAEVIAWLDEYNLRLVDDPKNKRCPHCGQLMRTARAPL